MELPSAADTAGLDLPSAAAAAELDSSRAAITAGLDLPSAAATAELDSSRAAITAGLDLLSAAATAELDSSRAAITAGLDLPSAAITAGLDLPSAAITAGLDLPNAVITAAVDLPSATAIASVEPTGIATTSMLRSQIATDVRGNISERENGRSNPEQLVEVSEAMSTVGSEGIDEVPHRPPSPRRDFDAYNEFIARLTPDQYHNMFALPITHRHNSESGSDVNSNERYVRDFDGPDSVESESDSQIRVPNANNMIGSREDAAQDRQRLERRWNEQLRSSDRVEYVDDTALIMPERRVREVYDNNMHLQAAGSSDTVVLPAREPTVLPPPPIMRRVPRLEDQDPMFRARQREMFALYRTGALRQESSHESNQSTDSGEYTIRDGSPRSSGHHHSSRNSEHVEPGSVVTSPRAPASLVVAAAVLSNTITPSEGAPWWPDIVVQPPQDETATNAWLIAVSIVGGWIMGVFTVWCCCKTHAGIRASSVSLAASQDQLTAVSLAIPREHRTVRRRRHRGREVFATPNGECIHITQDCPTVRNSRTLIRRHMCTVCAVESDHAPRNA